MTEEHMKLAAEIRWLRETVTADHIKMHEMSKQITDAKASAEVATRIVDLLIEALPFDARRRLADDVAEMGFDPLLREDELSALARARRSALTLLSRDTD